MHEIWTFDGKKRHDIDAIAGHINDLLMGKRLVISTHETGIYAGPSKRRRGRLKGGVIVRKGSHGDIYIPVKAGISVPLKPIRHDGETYASEINIDGEELIIYVPHLIGDPPAIVERNYAITVVGPRR